MSVSAYLEEMLESETKLLFAFFVFYFIENLSVCRLTFSAWGNMDPNMNSREISADSDWVDVARTQFDDEIEDLDLDLFLDKDGNIVDDFAADFVLTWVENSNQSAFQLKHLTFFTLKKSNAIRCRSGVGSNDHS